MIVDFTDDSNEIRSYANSSGQRKDKDQGANSKVRILEKEYFASNKCKKKYGYGWQISGDFRVK